jgi:hypothetical protein
MDQQFDETEDDILADDDGDGGLMWMLLILPLLALMGMG